MYQIIPTRFSTRKLFVLFPLILLGMVSAGVAQDAAKKPEPSLMTYKFRVARPTDNMKEVLRFYRDGLGLEVLFSFNHEGYEGQMLGRRDGPYHLEFLHQRGRKFGKAPTKNNLLVFYMPEAEWKAAVERMQKHGYRPVKSYNPYWDEKANSKTFEDFDGYRVVLVESSRALFRVVRSSDNLPEVRKFYRDALGLDVTMGGKDGKHEGVVFGRKAGAPYELEFENMQSETYGKAPTEENLLVFYIPGKAEWERAVERMKKHGYLPVETENPWGSEDGKTFEDVDGYRVVLKNQDWWDTPPIAGKQNVLFDKKFTSPLNAEWYWVREDAKSWKVENGKLLLRSLPGAVYTDDNNAPNVLLRSAPVTSGALTIEVFLENQPELPYEHAGLYWYYDDDNYVCILKEWMGTEVLLRLITEKNSKATTAGEPKYTAGGVWLRLVIEGDKASGYYRQTDKDEWQGLGQVDLPRKGEPKAGLSAGGGPQNSDRWVSFSHFRILEQGR
jgi:catechol 2,3-dioxygenase-like lactoylglutathione lyase family enzyme